MGNTISQHLTPGEVYSRNDLMSLFKITDATIRNGIFRPKGFDSVWLFITEEKTRDRTQYKDQLDGDDLYFEGQTEGRTDDLLIRHRELGLEVLTFYRKKRNEHPNFAFRYEGPFEYLSSKKGRPTKFHLRRVGASSTQFVELEVVKTETEVRENIRRFHRDFSGNLSRAKSLMSQTTSWVYDEDTGLFGPGTFVGFSRMSLERYNAACDGRSIDAQLDEGKTRAAIANVIGVFAGNPDLAKKCHNWMATNLGSAFVKGIEEDKWNFVRLKSDRHYWAFACDPDDYDTLGAVATLDELTLYCPRSNPSPGDRLVLWQTKGEGDRRGVIALGDVVQGPAMMGDDEAELQFYRGQPSLGPERRIRFRVIRYPGLPLWEFDHTELLSNLTVARAHGGTEFYLTPDEWHEIRRLAGTKATSASSPAESRVLGQGFGLTAAERKAVERYAQKLAEDHFLALGFEVTDVSRSKPYDLLCRRSDEEVRVEVKGTTGTGCTVILTRNEVRHVQQHTGVVVLYVVRNIELDHSGTEPVAGGGQVELLQPWKIDHASLAPLQYEYRLPPRQDVP